MKKYRVMVEGANFLLDMDGALSKYGFFTTRLVEAWDDDEAESIVIKMLRTELQHLVQNEKTDSPMMFVDELQEIKSFDGPVPGAGFAWFPDEKGH